MSDVEDMKGTHCGDEDTGKEPIKPTATPDSDNHRGGAKIPKYSIIPYQKLAQVHVESRDSEEGVCPNQQ